MSFSTTGVRVEVVGLSALCSLGVSKERIFHQALNDHLDPFRNGLFSIAPEEFDVLKTSVPERFRASRFDIMTISAMEAALADAQWDDAKIQDCGFVFATTTGEVDRWESVLPSFPECDLSASELSSCIQSQSLGHPIQELRRHFGMKGRFALVASSCSASLQALALALLWIKSGKVHRCLVGSTEIHSDLTRLGFESLRLISKSKCRPFDVNRDGINLGEGGAFLCLERSSPEERSQKSWGYLEGAGLSSDAFHPTAPQPEGLGSIKAMSQALQMAKVTAEEIDWVYAHGTGSPSNDQAEGCAIQSLFRHRPWITGTKGLHGHMLGASGAIESVLGLMSMRENLILPTYQFETLDPKLELNVADRVLKNSVRAFIKNSLGFGGINAAVVFSRE